MVKLRRSARYREKPNQLAARRSFISRSDAAAVASQSKKIKPRKILGLSIMSPFVSTELLLYRRQA
jgi:hypothetical protein